jgi:hypothetical protein
MLAKRFRQVSKAKNRAGMPAARPQPLPRARNQATSATGAAGIEGAPRRL